MTTIILLFIFISTLASIIVVAACIKSSKITQWEELPEMYETEAEWEQEPATAPIPLLKWGLTSPKSVKEM